MSPAPKPIMQRRELVDWLASEGFTPWQVRLLIERGIIRAYRWEEVLGERARGLSSWKIFLETQVREALSAARTTQPTRNDTIAS